MSNKTLIQIQNQNSFIGSLNAKVFIEQNFEVNEVQRLLDDKHTKSIMKTVKKYKEKFICDSIVMVVRENTKFEIVDGQHRKNAFQKLNEIGELPNELYIPVLIHYVLTEEDKNKSFEILSKSKPIDEDMVFL